MGGCRPGDARIVGVPVVFVVVSYIQEVTAGFVPLWVHVLVVVFCERAIVVVECEQVGWYLTRRSADCHTGKLFEVHDHVVVRADKAAWRLATDTRYASTLMGSSEIRYMRCCRGTVGDFLLPLRHSPGKGLCSCCGVKQLCWWYMCCSQAE